MLDYPERKPNRLLDYDYSMPGWYFVTTCVKIGNVYLVKLKIVKWF